jgi:hypothetical protein
MMVTVVIAGTSAVMLVNMDPAGSVLTRYYEEMYLLVPDYTLLEPALTDTT